MIQEYTLKNVKARHIDSINKDLYEAGATAADGQEYNKVTLWKSDWATVDIKDGITIRAEMKITEKNGYKNVILYPERTNTLYPKKNTPNIAKAQERKAEYIAEAQERKNESIAFFNSTNSAIALIKELSKDIPFTNDDDYKRVIRKWRDFFLEEWRKYEASDMQDKHNAI